MKKTVYEINLTLKNKSTERMPTGARLELEAEKKVNKSEQKSINVD
jgi:hypothetical protein